MRVLFVISFCLCLGLALCSQAAQFRKPQITISSKQSNDCSGTTLLYRGVNKAHAVSKSIKDVASFVKGTFHIEASNQMFVGDLFKQPRANLLIAIDALGQNGAVQSELLGANNAQGKCVAANPLAQLSTAMTGVSANRHGIFNNRWINAKGVQEQAFTSESTFSDVQTLSDVFANHFDGKSLIISASASETFAKAASAHPITSELSTEGRINSFSYNAKTGEFTDANGKYKLAKKSIVEKVFAFVQQLSSDSMSFSVDAEKKQITVQIPESKSTITFSLNNDESFLFFGELAMFSEVLNHIKSMRSADAPDFFAFTVSSLRAIGDNYGYESEQFRAAVRVLEAAVDKLMADFASIYDQRTAGQIVLLGRAAELSSTQKQAISAVLKDDLADESSLSTYLPGVYLKSTTPKERIEKHCAALSSALASADITVSCNDNAESESTPSTGRKLLYWSARVAKASTSSYRKAKNNNNNAFTQQTVVAATVDYYNNTTPNFVTISEYQVSLWAALGLIAIAVIAVYALGSIDYTHDSLLMTTDSSKEY